ncbi:hypothetical protein Lpar_0339 [Legionella parisiensis]|uniref:Uncharacterized protein n=1 Tax=Legionella parisiensis TaxID=45071 RepID=A0A1E5JNE3_9GAMM|nr:hypothetical protein Lpar_0339 [Legionella parisiensis]OEH46049.1 hypothetical protein lpari_02931 [Legionella parisiensis]STX71878.1 Uncharacterised protein [Legionella parisiensis]
MALKLDQTSDTHIATSIDLTGSGAKENLTSSINRTLPYDQSTLLVLCEMSKRNKKLTYSGKLEIRSEKTKECK